MDGFVFEHHWNAEDFRYFDGHQDGDRLHFIYRGFFRDLTDPEDAVWQAIGLLNRDDRPSGLLGPSYSGGDVIAVWTTGGEWVGAWTSDGISLRRTDLTPETLDATTERSVLWINHTTEGSITR